MINCRHVLDDPRIFFKGAIYNVFDTISPSFFYQGSLFIQKIVIFYRGVCRMSQVGPTIKMLVFWLTSIAVVTC